MLRAPKRRIADAYTPLPQVKTPETDGYMSLQLGVGERKPKNVNKALTMHYAKAAVKPKRKVNTPKETLPYSISIIPVPAISLSGILMILLIYPCPQLRRLFASHTRGMT